MGIRYPLNMSRQRRLPRQILAAIAALALAGAAPCEAIASNFAAAARAGRSSKGFSVSAAVPALGIHSLNSNTPATLSTQLNFNSLPVGSAPQFARARILNNTKAPEQVAFAASGQVPTATSIRFKAAEWSAPQPNNVQAEVGRRSRRDAAPSTRAFLQTTSREIAGAVKHGDIAAISASREVFDAGRSEFNTGEHPIPVTWEGGRSRSGLRKSAGLKTVGVGAAIAITASPAAAAETAGPMAATSVSASWLAPIAAIAAPLAYAWSNPLKPDYGEVDSKKMTFSRFMREAPDAIVYGTAAVAITSWLGYLASTWLVPGAAPIILPVLIASAGFLGSKMMQDEVGKARSVRTGGYQVSHDIDRLIGVGDNKRKMASKEALSWSYGSGHNINGTGNRGDRYDANENGLVGATAIKVIRSWITAIAFGVALIVGISGPWLYLFAGAITLFYFIEDLRLKLRGPPTAPVASNHIDL
jgi:hypothetical protein